MFRCYAAIALLLIAGVSFASGQALVHPVTDQRLLTADKDAANWITHGRDYAEQRFSPLHNINTETIDRLSLAWFYEFDDKRGLQATPLVIDGIMYVTASWSVVVALDAENGDLLWTFDPQVPKEKSYKYCCGAVNRGVAVWGEAVFVGTLDGRLIAIDRATGEQRWSVQTTPEGDNYSITGAPRVVKGKVIIGNAGSEYGVRGYVSAYDAATGELVWRFYTVPGNPALGFENAQMAMAAETWNGEWWTFGGGGTVWDSLAYDPELDLLYVGVGNGAPHSKHIRSPGGGDNLFLCSILALRPDTGEYVWHYQEVPGETWDYTATQHMILADLPWQGVPRKLLLHAPKSGFFYVLDRETGQLLSAEKFGTRVNWASHYDLDSGRPVLTPGADYPTEPFMVYPIGVGSHNWHPMSFSPNTGLVYIPGQHIGGELSTETNFKLEENVWNTGVETSLPLHNQQLNSTLGKAFVNGFLLAWNPLTQQKAWQVSRPYIGNGGVLSTAGQLVFQGTIDGFFTAYDAQSGTEMFRFEAGNGIVGSPISYAVNDTQFVSVPVARGGGISLISGSDLKPASANGRILAFSLNGAAALPSTRQVDVFDAKPPARLTADDAVLERGLQLYHRYCNRCHGSGVVSDGSIADLRYLTAAWHDNFEDVVLNGMMVAAGMPRFDQVLDSEGVFAIQAYVIDQSHQAYAMREGNSLWLAIKQTFYDLLAWCLLTLDELAQ